MIVTTSLSRRGLVRAGGGLLLTGILPIDDNVSDWGRSLQGRGADRFERAQEFYQGVAAGLYRDPRDLLYQAGIVAQLLGAVPFGAAKISVDRDAALAGMADRIEREHRREQGS